MPNTLLTALRATLRAVRQELWFRPVIWILATLLVATPLFALSFRLDAAAVPGVLSFEVEAVRELLRFLATAMLTVTTVSFSVIVVVMTVAAGQISPRAIPGILRDSTIQNALGVFLSGFVFGVVGLLGFSQVSSAAPAVLVATLISGTLAGLAVVYFVRLIHHVSQRIQVTQVLAQQRDLANRAIADYFEGSAPGGASEDRGESLRDGEPLAIGAEVSGYVQLLHLAGLFEIAERNDLMIRAAVAEGSYVALGAPLLEVWPGNELDGETRDALSGAIRIGVSRTPEGDPLFPLEILGEVGERALSPGVNDTSTALAALDHLAECLRRWADYPPPRERLIDKEGRLRVVVRPPALALALTRTLGRIGRSGRDHPEIRQRIAAVIADLERRPGFTARCREAVENFGGDSAPTL